MRAIQPELTFVDGLFQPGLVVVIDGDAISAVIPRAEVPDSIGIEPWAHHALVPGTVNAHGHAFQNLFKGFADDRSFEDWRDAVLYPFSEGLSIDDIYTGALFAFTEALLAGVTTTVDFFYLHDDGNENADAVIRAARDAGIRLVLARAFYDLDAPTNAPARFRESATDAAARTRELAEAYREDPAVLVQPAPHSLHAASPETIAVALEVAQDLDVPFHLHLAEATYERDMIVDRFGLTPVRLLADRGLLHPRLVAVHAVWLDDDEVDLIAAAGAGVVHCPGANAFLGDGIARAAQMIAKGVRVALGPDGGCANNRQSVFDEMRTASLLAKATATDGSVLPAPAAFDLGTRAGADLLGIPAGSIAPGMFADLVGLDLEDLSLQPPANLERMVVHSMQPSAIARVMVGGEVVVERGSPSRVDVPDLRRRIGETTARWERPS
ncbi:MAG: 5-methylthioadenosine/S-adenosylhomocysteine deaminase [Actinomycetota bacterium]|jgi:5-methylthioadenosine/S-adenosylhomocysteine deaminase|nr:5-methylthioadenosine/S-adenosylhomocysteine deaminase [Actinomycetota bacterium]